ncbi:transmembrane protein 220 isoform 1-T1 [Synchiropus picturatus]
MSTCLTAVWRTCNVFMSVFFALASYVQINDPDAALWMVAYGVPALLCAVIGFNPRVTESLVWRRAADFHVLISSAAVSVLGWKLHKLQTADVLQQEEGRSCVLAGFPLSLVWSAFLVLTLSHISCLSREFSGLLITVLWFLLCRHSGRSAVGTLRVATAVAITTFPFVAWLHYYINQELRASWPSHCKTAI